MSNYPTMDNLEEARAPWNEPIEKYETVDTVVSHSFDFKIPVNVPTELDDNYILASCFKEQYPTLEEVFEYLKEHFKNPEDDMQRYIKSIANQAVVTDCFVDYY